MKTKIRYTTCYYYGDCQILSIFNCGCIENCRFKNSKLPNNFPFDDEQVCTHEILDSNYHCAACGEDKTAEDY